MQLASRLLVGIRRSCCCSLQKTAWNGVRFHGSFSGVATMSAPPAAEKSAAEVKTDRVLEFLTPLLQAHFSVSGDWSSVHSSNAPPFFLGVNGIQGSGKTTLVRCLANVLRKSPFGIRTAVLSIDDLYLPHDGQQALAQKHPDNPLVQHRGQPGTHDVDLGVELFESLKAGKRTLVPSYDKSAFSGEGDRVPRNQWEVVNDDPRSKIKIVIFEGWCVGFRSLDRGQVVAKWHEAAEERKASASYPGQLGRNSLESVEFINARLREYDELTDSFDALVHIDCADTLWVYDWRLEQEAELLETKGSGMTSDQVKKFVDGYYPAYELFYEKIRQGIFKQPGKQLRLIVGKDRATQQFVQI